MQVVVVVELGRVVPVPRVAQEVLVVVAQVAIDILRQAQQAQQV
jgi:hypothetical protein